MKQQSFSALEQVHKKKRAKQEIFLGQMDLVVPWARLEALFHAINTYLQERALLLRGGTIMDATLITASPSTKKTRPASPTPI